MALPPDRSKLSNMKKLKCFSISSRLALSALILFSISCSSISDLSQRCVRAEDVSAILPTLEKTADANAQWEKKPVTDTVLVEKTCQRHVYTRSGHRLLIFSTPNDPETAVRGTVSDSKKQVRTPECFNKALAEIKGYGRPEFKNVIQEQEKRAGNLWSDMEVGPVKWLQCGKPSGQEWTNGLSTMIHEMNHENFANDCSLLPKDSRRLCFDLPEDFPKTDLAGLDVFPTKDPADIKILKDIQDLYAGKEGRSALTLFDELNSYTLTTLVMTARLKKFGTSALYVGNSRPVATLPLFMLFTTRYLKNLKAKHPEEAEKYFSRQGTNFKNIEILLSEAEAAHKSWVKALKKGNRTEFPVEAALWREYLVAKSTL